MEGQSKVTCLFFLYKKGRALCVHLGFTPHQYKDMTFFRKKQIFKIIFYIRLLCYLCGMKNIILFSLLFFPLLGFSQTNRDSIIMRNPQIQTNPNLLLNSATNLIDAGKSYETADNLVLLGVATAIVGGLIYQKHNNVGKQIMFASLVLDISSLFERYNGHRNLKESGQNLRNYTKSL
jgi:hypothetical protein